MHSFRQVLRTVEIITGPVVRTVLHVVDQTSDESRARPCKYQTRLTAVQVRLSMSHTNSFLSDDFLLPSSVKMSDGFSYTNFSDTPNFVSFSSPPQSKPVASAPVHQPDLPKANPTATLYESAETKRARLQAFADHLKQAIEAAQTRASDDENDHAIEYIYQVGTQQRLFVDYRPDEATEHLNARTTLANAFATKNFRGKLYIDDVYVCAGQGTNKTLCKRHCFQQALNRFLNENFDVSLFTSKDGREQYELTTKMPQEDQEVVGKHDDQEPDSFHIPASHPMTNTKMSFVHARDTTTIAGRTARLQSKLEQQYWQQWGRGVPLAMKPRRTQRSLSPPPPVPHQSMEQKPSTVFEAMATTPASVAVNSPLCASTRA